MPKLLMRQEAPRDVLTGWHADPDARPDLLVDGLSIDGLDLFAERRRLMRERHDRRPEPALLRLHPEKIDSPVVPDLVAALSGPRSADGSCACGACGALYGHLPAGGEG
jgi:hypothetical protein